MKLSSLVTLLLLLLLSINNVFAGRYYDSKTGRWLSVDPKAGKYPGMSPYNYCLNNPLRNIDPDGNEPITLTATGVTIGGAVTIALVGHTYNYLTNPSYRSSYDSFTSSLGKVAGKAIDNVLDKVTSWFNSGDSENSNPWNGTVDNDVNIADNDGNIIPVKAGEQVQGSKDGSMIQVKDANGKPTGTRKDGKGHPKKNDPKAQKPHGHRVDEQGNPITKDGNPHLPIN